MVASEQGGSRKDHSSNVLGAEVGLNFDILRQKRWAVAHVGLDASQCYDRVVHAPAALCMIQHGAHEPAVRSMFGTIQGASNKVTTAFGTSTSCYGGPQRAAQGLPPIQGSGQGNGAGPACFAGMSSTGISCMRKKGYGAALTACISLVSLVLACFMWVDDQQYQQTARSGTDSGDPPGTSRSRLLGGLPAGHGGSDQPRQVLLVLAGLEMDRQPMDLSEAARNAGNSPSTKPLPTSAAPCQARGTHGS